MPNYKTNKVFFRKLQNKENKVTIQINGKQGDTVKVLSNGKKNLDYTRDYNFLNENNPSQIILNNQSIPYEVGNDLNFLEIQFNMNGLNTIEITWNYTLTNLKLCLILAKKLNQ